MKFKKMIFPALCGLVGCLLAAGLVVGEEEKNAEKEKSFTPEAYYESLAAAEKQRAEKGGKDIAPGFYYTVEKGDTLWDLSQKFYDSQWEWPAMWAQNKQLENPHRIYPGQRIRLYQKTEPFSYPEKKAPAKKPEPEKEKATETPEPAPEPEKAEVTFVYPEIMNVGFVKKLSGAGMFEKPEDPLAVGKIIKGQGENAEMLSEGNTVFIQRFKMNPSFIVGNQYSIYKPLKVINHEVTGKYAGHQYKIAGVAEITDTDSDYVTARIVKAVQPIRVGDFIMPYPERLKEIRVKSAPEGVTGYVLGADDNTELSADYDTIFLDKGQKDGVRAGQQYEIYSQSQETIDGKKVALPPKVYGKVLVLFTQDTTATAVITSCKKSVHPGARFKTPS